ncbi:MAG: hypothetical protein OXD42_04230 [Rhodospirillaceae bacterium]|nr:hypothetical protein [Rhodospirillaceae bacterium]
MLWDPLWNLFRNLEFLMSADLEWRAPTHIFDRTIGPERMKAWVRCT